MKGIRLMWCPKCRSSDLPGVTHECPVETDPLIAALVEVARIVEPRVSLGEHDTLAVKRVVLDALMHRTGGA